MPTHFSVPLLNAWDIHNFSFVNEQKTFIVLADTDEGPSIVQMRQSNTIGVMFDVQDRYQETMLLIKNYIVHTLSSFKLFEKY